MTNSPRLLAALLLFCASLSAHAGSIQFSSAAFTTNEITTPGVVTLTRTGVTTAAATVLVTTANGTATVTSDYTAVSITVSWAAGDAANNLHHEQLRLDKIRSPAQQGLQERPTGLVVRLPG